MFSNFEAYSTAQIKFELSLLGSENCCVTLSLPFTAAAEQIVLLWLFFLLLSEQLQLIFFLFSTFFAFHYTVLPTYLKVTLKLTFTNIHNSVIVMFQCTGKENQQTTYQQHKNLATTQDQATTQKLSQTTQLTHFCNRLASLFYIPVHFICTFLGYLLIFINYLLF